MKRHLLLVVAAVTVVVATAAGCSRGGENDEGPSTASAAAASAGDFGDLTNLCHGGTATTAPAQGVTTAAVKLGVFTDVGFTKNSELVDAAHVFTSWCNDHGGVGGRKLVPDIHDAALMQVQQRMVDACRDDFALVGGSAALDGLGVKARLSCLLPDFPAQVDQVANTGSDLQVGGGSIPGYDSTTGFHQWLLGQYPGSAGAVGLISGDTPITKIAMDQYEESLPQQGATVVYSDLYPAAGVTDWTPYAQALKSKGVKGLIFLGDYAGLAKLEDVLTGMDYKLDWIDTNSNAYTPAFPKLAATSVATQHNYLDLGGTAPLDAQDRVPAVAQVNQLFAKYAPGKVVTLPALRAFVAWTLFVKSADSCGDKLTRQCVYTAATGEHAWTGGGMQAPVEQSPTADRAPKCFNVQQATPSGWKSADFGADTGTFRCDMIAYKLHGDYGKPATLADVGKSINDLK
ncbi:ABC transporter substrate-binding protein [Nocardia sp. alder85J]|uniref:ABC transporter substrate-binding protein n=1 Tax=Nocardia sp. alder85J TaxID=2862949 RepID=UPI001CD56394|nr:ABC transporter substrate-binding protein [Nocardia sp. alder85J]MCX4098366.1 ABC transporter substrate-binding protein [Nocardia sp. alder85J]